MKKTMLCLAVLLAGISARAQTAPAPLIITPPAGILTPADWVKIGGAFGPKTLQGDDAPGSPSGPRSWQFGFDKSLTAGICMGYDIAHGQFLGGGCRDLFKLAHRQQDALHLGFLVGWDSSHAHSAYLGRLGMTVGPATSAFLNQAADKIPALEAIAGWQAPAPLAYIGKIATVDFMGGPYSGADAGAWAYGPEIKADIPLADLWALVGGK